MASGLGGLAAFLSYPSDSWQSLAGAVAADMGGTAWLLVWLGRTPEAKLVVNPLTGMLGLYALRRLLGLINVVGQSSFLASPFDAVPTGAYIVASAKAEWVTLVGTAAFCFGWVLARQRRTPPGNAASLTGWHNRQLWLVYFIGLTVFLEEWLSHGALAKFGNVITITGGLAFGAIFALLAFSKKYGVNGRLRMLTYAALLPLMANVLTFGMKGQFFIALLPLGAAYLLRKPGRGLALAAAGALFLMVFVYPYVQEYRATNWGESATGATVGEVAQQVQHNIEQEGVSNTVKSSWEQFELRFGSVNEAGAVIYFADKTGFMGSFFIKNLMYGFIPRMLWPAKPSWDPAGWFSDFLAGNIHTRSATALHIAPELYWMYGWPGTFFGLLLLGFYYRKVSDSLLRLGAGQPVFWAAWYSFLIFVTFIEEARYNMAILMPFILLSNALAISWALKFLLPKPRRVIPRTSLAVGAASGRESV